MKIKKLLLGSALLIASTAMAGITERQKPTFSEDPIQPFTDNETAMYMYNVGAEKFFAAGNDWGTQTSISDNAYQVYFEQYLIDGAWDGTTVYFHDTHNGQRKTVFFDQINGTCYVDHNGQANYHWKLEKNTDNDYYRLSMAEVSPDYASWQESADLAGRTFFGWKESYGTKLFAFTPATNDACVDWAFYTESAYNAYKSDLEVFATSEQLKEILLNAIENGLNLPEQEAVYNNPASTIEELQAAISSAKKAIAAAEEEMVEPTNPIDKTSFIQTPNFDNNKKDGWEGNSLSVDYGIAEFYDRTYNTYQNISNLPNGVYAVSVQSFLRTGWDIADYNKYEKNNTSDAVLYVANGIDSLTASVPYIYVGASSEKLGGGESELTLSDGSVIYVPSNREGTSIYFQDPVVGPKFRKTIMIAVIDGTLKIGSRLDKHDSGNWFVMDNWNLKYYGKKAGAYTMMLENALSNAPQFGDDVVATVGMIEAYNTLLSGLTATSYEEVTEELAKMNAAASEVQENVNLWKTYEENLKIASDLPAMGGYVGEAADALADYCLLEGEEYLEEKTLTNDELKVELEKLAELIDAAKAGVKPGTEIQNEYIYNWNFEDTNDGKNDGRGWEGEWGQYGGPSNNKCMEAYGAAWDVHQEVKNAPAGVYEISFQGFYRIEHGETAWNYWINKEQECPGVLYFNNNTAEFKCVFEEAVHLDDNNVYMNTEYQKVENPEVPGDTLLFPETMYTAGNAFSAGMFNSSVYGVVPKKGDSFTIGVRGKRVSATWTIWDNFRVIYWGTQADKVLPVLDKAIADAEASLEKNITKEVYDMINDAISNAEKVKANNDGKEMFEALVAVNNSIEAIETTEASIDSLYELAGNLYAVIYEVSAPANTLVAAEELAIEVITKVESKEITMDEVADYKQRIAEMIILLQVKGDGTDENPESMTHLLKTPDFEIEGMNSAEGWVNATGNTGNNETQKSVYAYEYWRSSFDMYQELNGMPEGTYRIEIYAFAGLEDEPDAGAKKYESGIENTAAQFYAVTSLGEFTQNLVPWVAGAWTEDKGITDGMRTVQGENTTYYGPYDIFNTVTYFFNEGAYRNILYANVAKDGQLRIGIRNTESNQWVVMDNVQLYYLGKNSQYAETAKIIDISCNETLSKEIQGYYDVAGNLLNAPKAKGITIVRYMDGHADKIIR